MKLSSISVLKSTIKTWCRPSVNAIEAWSLNHKIRRIEATVVTENGRAVELFKGTGFQIEGELKDKHINGHYYNEYVMAKILN